MNREAWLEKATKQLRPWFEEAGAPLPENVRVSCGWPSRSALGQGKRRIGECWSPKAAANGTHQVFISPVLAQSTRVLDVLVHELVHAAVGVEHGHKAPFKRLATALGLTGKATATVAGPGLLARLAGVVTRLGEYPHGTLDGLVKTKQGTRLLKASCPDCGYTVRLTQKWVEVGLPTCPCGTAFELET